jgi:hypothetical protein
MIEGMRYGLLALALAGLGCAPANPENSASCGFAILGAANKALEQLYTGNRTLLAVPEEFRGTVATRVPGHGTTPGLVGETPDGPIVAYDGEGFPPVSGFGIMLVNDSTDTFEGVLIYDLEPPMGLPVLGGVTNGRYVIPLYGMRVAWAAVSTERCPLFAALDTTGT